MHRKYWLPDLQNMFIAPDASSWLAVLTIVLYKKIEKSSSTQYLSNFLLFCQTCLVYYKKFIYFIGLVREYELFS